MGAFYGWIIFIKKEPSDFSSIRLFLVCSMRILKKNIQDNADLSPENLLLCLLFRTVLLQFHVMTLYMWNFQIYACISRALCLKSLVCNPYHMFINFYISLQNSIFLQNFYKTELNKEEMYIRYIHKLYDLHLKAQNFTGNWVQTRKRCLGLLHDLQSFANL